MTNIYDSCKDCTEYGSDFCEDCLKESRYKEAMIDALRTGICVVTFTKKNGEERVMSCTLNEEFLPEQIDLEEAVQKKVPNLAALAVWDTDIGAWRSFRWDSLKDFKKEINL
jgi:esterase/lipase superfamily enzyme